MFQSGLDEDYSEFDLREELTDALLIADNGAFEDPALPEFHIDDEKKLIWFTEKLEARARQIAYYTGLRNRRLEKLKQIFQREMLRIEEDANKLVEQPKRDILFLLNRFGPEVKALAPTLVKRGAKSKKWSNSQIGSRETGERLRVLDDKALEAWCMTLDDETAKKVLKVDTKVNLSEVAKVYKSTGEIPTGMAKVPSKDEFFIKVHDQNILDLLGDDWLGKQNFVDPLNEVPVTEGESSPAPTAEDPENDAETGSSPAATVTSTSAEEPPL